MEETAAPAAPDAKPVKPRWGRQAGVGKQKGTPNKVTVLMRDMARSLTLGNEKVLERLGAECESGKIHPAVFIKLLEYGYGRVKYVFEVETPESPARTMAEAMRQLTREDQMKLYEITRRMQLPARATVIDVKTTPERAKRGKAKKKSEAPPA